MTNFLPLLWVSAFLLTNPVSVFSDFTFNGFRNAGNNITLYGVADITSAGILKLSNHTSRLIGRAFYTNPIRFKNSTTGKALSFSTSFAFAIVPEYDKLGGHGLAFAISPTKELTGALPSQYLGLLNATDNGNFSNHIFAVEFDTVKDYEFGDIDDNHVGIDINSLASNASTPAGYFVEHNSSKQEINLKSGKTIQAWIDYDSTENQVNVTLSLSSSKPSSPLLSFSVDLSEVLQDSMYVGFSASTGLLASSHYVFGWNFNMSGPAEPLDLSSLPSLPGPKKNRKNGIIIGVSISAIGFSVIAVVVALYLIKRIKNKDVIEEWERHVGPHRFPYNELQKATRGFREKELIGSGGFGRVYKGILPVSKTPVAVKRISHESKQGLQEFVSEISTIGRLRHRNLVQLVGWCRRGGDLLLVYDFMENGSLDKYIYEKPKLVLSWKERFKIMKGVASGLLYLHEEWEQTVLHRDVKAGNVLLDSEFNGRLGDFGLAKFHEHGSTPSTTRVVGTLGYLAPELTRTGKPTTSSDVFAFGALLLEVTCGRRPIEAKSSPEELILVDWVWEKWKGGEIIDVVDKRLRGEFDEVEALVVLKLGLMCSNNEPMARPSMRQVVRYLEGEAMLPEGLPAPNEYDRKGSSVVEFEDFVHSYPSSAAFEKVRAWSIGDGEGVVDIEAGLSSESSSRCS